MTEKPSSSYLENLASNMLEPTITKNPKQKEKRLQGRRKKCYSVSFKLNVVNYFEEGHSKKGTARAFQIDKKCVQ